MRKLTKSRYKLGLECPNKLYYTRKPQYADNKKEDPFLQALAQGGFQVEELARMHFPGGILLEDRDNDYDHLAQTTRQHMEDDEVTLYEPAFDHDDLFVRVDILVKKGNKIDLIEVKSKTFDPSDQNLFIGRNGIRSGWKPYLFDIAFQHYVVSRCLPECTVRAHIMMADKNKKASIDGLNQLFRIVKDPNNRTGIEKKVESLDEIGNSVLSSIDVTEIIRKIQEDEYKYHDNLGFHDSIITFRDHYRQDKYYGWPTSFNACKSCEFRTDDPESGLLSGFHECFRKQHGWSDADFDKPSIMDIWNFRRGDKLFEKGKFFMADLTEEDVGVDPTAHGLSNAHRQWIQIEKAVARDRSIYVDRDSLKEAMSEWKYPLHFIDFETSAVALPFHKGRGPYEQTAFQFSHHTVHEDGRITHGQFLMTDAGVFPNFDFMRALKAQLDHDEGSIFRFATHENTILNAIYEQLLDSNEADKEDLLSFIRGVSYSKKDFVDTWVGKRSMIDLCDVIKKYYYNPLTGGSNSMKKVLPAIFRSSDALKEKYASAIGELGIDSCNFDSSHRWIKMIDGEVQDPYTTLPPLFDGWTEEDLETAMSGMEGIADGGAALTAYGKLQFTDMTKEERNELNAALLKYCELDTLAMVMVWEELHNLCL
jgi:hypothetical protein